MWRTTHLEAVREDMDTEPDDDTSLYRLFGFALFVGISSRKKIIFGRLKKVRKRNSKQESYKLLQVLLSLVEKDKAILPACINFQDRGNMTFPDCKYLPFSRLYSEEIKKHLRPSRYHVVGRLLLLVCKNVFLYFL